MTWERWRRHEPRRTARPLRAIRDRRGRRARTKRDPRAPQPRLRGLYAGSEARAGVVGVVCGLRDAGGALGEAAPAHPRIGGSRAAALRLGPVPRARHRARALRGVLLLRARTP